MNRISVKTMFLLAEAGAAGSMLTLSATLAAVTGEGWALIAGVLLTGCALAWMFLLTLFFAKRLSRFTSGLCRTMDRMIIGSEETVLNRADADDGLVILQRGNIRCPAVFRLVIHFVTFRTHFITNDWMAACQ